MIYGDTDECAEGVTTTLIDPTGKSVETKTNTYGNFEFDGLDVGKYSVKLECAGYAPKIIDVDLKTDSYLEDITLTKT